MKKFLQFAGLVGALLGIVAFVLLLATEGVVWSSGNTRVVVEGTTVLFGKSEKLSAFGVNLGEAVTKGAWVALLAWIFIIVAVLVLLCLGVCELLKVKAVEKFATLLTFVAGGLLVAAGVLLFFTVPSFIHANGGDNLDGYGLGAGWVVSAILAIVGGGLAVLPPVLSLVGKK